MVNGPIADPEAARKNKASTVAQIFEKLGSTEIVRRAFAAAKSGNKDAKLILNAEPSETFESIIEQALEAGVPIDAIGLRTHMHDGYWGHKKIWDLCERFRRFDLPIHFTEVTILSGKKQSDESSDSGFDESHSDETATSTAKPPVWFTSLAEERRQRDNVRELYRVLFSHPSVEAISWWDFCDQNAWMNAPGGLLDEDLRAKPAFYELKALVHRGWTTRVQSRTNRFGALRFRGFYGDYDYKMVIDDVTYGGRFRISRDGPTY